MNYAVTGGTGFVGSSLLRDGRFNGAKSLGRKNSNSYGHFSECDLFNITEVSELLTGIDVLIHSAGLAHVDRPSSVTNLKDYNKVNFEMTRSLLNASLQAGVKHFVFLSTIKVLGEVSKPDEPFSEKSMYRCQNEYANSKRLAEEYIRQVAECNDIAYTIIRPPLIYGANVKGNMRQLLKLIDCSLPLPLARFKNKRSLLAIDNLIDFIWSVANNTASHNETFCLCDGDDLSFSEIVAELIRARGKRSILFSVPNNILFFLANCIGKSDSYKVISSNVEIDSSRASSVMGWYPKLNTSKGIRLYYG